MGILLPPRTAHSPWFNGKIETQNQHIARSWRNFLNDAANNWSSSAPNSAFAHNTIVNNTTEETSYEVVFGTKPQFPMSLKLGLYRNKHKLCCSEFCKDLPPHSHSENNLENQILDHLLRPQLSQALLERERAFKRIYSATSVRCREETPRSHAYRNGFKLGQHLRDRTKRYLRKSSPRSLEEPKISTKTTRIGYSNKTISYHTLGNSS